ncbi:MAG: AAA family ATPase [Candidatus Aenigmarchaeota archaeon]|nr:AAA family ATPase [Candidatus Aenigmarchaeota archaeon]
MKKERIETGIPGVDKLIGGGLLPHSLTLLTGTTGTGKTVMSSQFIYFGVKEHDAPGVYVSFEEPVDNIRRDCLDFGWDFEPLEKRNKIIFVRYDPFHVEDIYELIETNVKKIGAKRVVIDSISALGLYVRDIPDIRRMVFNISLLLRKLGCTSILISETLPMQNSLSRFGVEEFVTDNVIVLYYTKTGSQFSRALTIWKMRGSEHSNKLHPYRISNKGVTIYSEEEAFSKL